MGHYRKKPVVIEAVQVVSKENRYKPDVERTSWLASAINSGDVCWNDHGTPGYFITTLEGVMLAEVGDWIIRGVKGELYPCKPDIFAATYDPV